MTDDHTGLLLQGGHKIGEKFPRDFQATINLTFHSLSQQK